MSACEPFTFGIPLLPKAAARNWPLVEALLDLTMASLRAQTDQDFRIAIAGHDRPRLSSGASYDFVQADWHAEAVRADNLDSGRKKSLISADVTARGGGFLMFVDADDWVDTRLVATARDTVTRDQVGGIITSGFATDARSLRTVPLPHAGLFDGGFHRLCGSSVVARYDLDAEDEVRRDPFATLHEHYRWIEECRERGLAWRELDVAGTYVVNTTANHSEAFGPFARWRRTFADGVAREGVEGTNAHLARFGLRRDQVLSIERFF